MRIPDIQLTEQEQKLFGEIHFGWCNHDELRASLAPMAALFELLLNRSAITEVRLRYFTDPDATLAGVVGRGRTLSRRTGPRVEKS